MFLKIRYFFLLIISLLLIWQIYSKYLYLGVQVKNEQANADDQMLKTIIQNSNKSRVLVSVYYEALCPDSRSFFVRHLLPVYNKMGNVLDIDLIPYGHAQTTKVNDGQFSFECQHGPTECFGNKLHACAILGIENTSLRVKFVTCLIDDFGDPSVVGEKCAAKLNVPWKVILNCANGAEGDWLLKKYGERTHALKPPIKFVPTILLNENHHKQAAILKNLNKELCSNYQAELADECEK